MGFTRTTQETRVPPQDLGAERAALSAMLQGTEASREAIAKGFLPAITQVASAAGSTPGSEARP